MKGLCCQLVQMWAQGAEGGGSLKAVGHKDQHWRPTSQYSGQSTSPAETKLSFPLNSEANH